MAQMASLGTLTAARDNVLLQIGFFGGLRRSELVSIEVEYIARQAEGIAITLPRSKSDQLGKAIVKSIPYGARPCCAPASTPLASRPRQCSGRSASGASQPPRRCRGGGVDVFLEASASRFLSGATRFNRQHRSGSAYHPIAPAPLSKMLKIFETCSKKMSIRSALLRRACRVDIFRWPIPDVCSDRPQHKGEQHDCKRKSNS